MLKKLRGNVLVNSSVLSQLECNIQHAQAVKRHPACAISLLEDASCWKRLGAVEKADVVQPKEASLKDILAVLVFSINPPGEI